MSSPVRGQLRWAETAPGRPRPHLIIQIDPLNDSAPTTIALPVTLKPQQAGPPLTVQLAADTAGLGRPAWIRVTAPVTLRRSQLGEPITALTDDDLAPVLQALAAVTGITR